MSPSLVPVRALIFDLDGTLYRSARLDRVYEESLYHLIAERRRVTPAVARRLFAEQYAEVARETGIRPSKLFTLSRMGISDRIWAARHGRIACADYLRPNRRLRAVLEELAQWHRLGIVTNNHRANTLATLRALGVLEVFDEILTLSESRRFKPAPELYVDMAGRLGVEPEDCLSLGDRYDLDLEPAARAGLQTLLVRRLGDLYALPRVLQPRLAERRPVRTPAAARTAVPSAARALRAGRLVVVPTDTVYGLAAAPEPRAVRWLYRAKGRPESIPLALLLADPAEAAKYARVPPRARELMARHWPGALTLVLPARPGTPWGRITRGGRTVALRVPEHELLRCILRAAGGAAAVTSANRSGQPAPTSAREVDKKILAFSQTMIDAGPAKAGMPSTVVQLSGKCLKILRRGSIQIA